MINDIYYKIHLNLFAFFMVSWYYIVGTVECILENFSSCHWKFTKIKNPLPLITKAIRSNVSKNNKMLYPTTFVIAQVFNIEIWNQSNWSAQIFVDEHESCRNSRVCECNKVSSAAFGKLAGQCRCDVASYWGIRI